ncbi:MAG TPA: hypothetical protein VIN59_07505 [Alphaproteobacteria bacterium]
MSFRRGFKSVAVAGFMLGMIGAESLSYAAFPRVELTDNPLPPVTIEEVSPLQGNASCNAGCQSAIRYMANQVQSQYTQDRDQCETRFAGDSVRLQQCYNVASNWATIKSAIVGAMATGAGLGKVVVALDDDQNHGEKFLNRLKPAP